MPKQLKELKIFAEGLMSNSSSSDIPDEAAAFSQNIDPEAEGGTIGGISKDKIISEDGVTNPTANTFKLTIPEVYRGTQTFVITKETSSYVGTFTVAGVGDTYKGWHSNGGNVIDTSVSIDVSSNSGDAGNGVFTLSSDKITSISAEGVITMPTEEFDDDCKMIITYQASSVFYDVGADGGSTMWSGSGKASAGGSLFPSCSYMVLKTAEGLRNIIILIKAWSTEPTISTSDKIYTDPTNSDSGLYLNELAPKWRNSSLIGDVGTDVLKLDLYISTWGTDDPRKQIRDQFVEKWNNLTAGYLSDDEEIGTYELNTLCKVENGADDYTVNLIPQSVELTELNETINQYGKSVTDIRSFFNTNPSPTWNKFTILSAGTAVNTRFENSAGAEQDTGYTLLKISGTHPIAKGQGVRIDVGDESNLDIVTGHYITTNVRLDDSSGGSELEFFNLPSKSGTLSNPSGNISDAVSLESFHSPFEVDIDEGKGISLQATDIGITYDGETSNLISFDSKSNSMHIIEDIDNVEDSTNNPIVLKEGITHSGSASIVPYNKEARIGYGSLRGAKPNWVGKINRKQLDRDLNDIFIENQELAAPNEELAGYNYDKLIVPYLPPRDEMGKRWYQSQVIDMKYGGDNGSAQASGVYDYPAYQCVLRTGFNLGDVHLPESHGGGAYNEVADMALFDYNKTGGTPSDSADNNKNVVTMALNNHSTGNTAGMIVPFEGLTFVIGDTVETNASTSPLLVGAKKRFQNHANIRVTTGDVYMITQIAHDSNGVCTHIDVMFMGNVDTEEATGGTISADVNNLQGCGPAFGIGLNKGQQNLSWVNLWREPGGVDSSSDGTGGTAPAWGDSKTIPLNNLFGEVMSGEISAINWSHSYMTTALDGNDKKRKINKKYGTIIFAQNDQNTSLFRFDLHLNSNNTSETAGPDNPKLSLEDSTILLDFSKIPNKLTESNRAIIDPPVWDPDMGDDSWTKFPKDAYITDICDTWSRRDADEKGDAYTYYGSVSTIPKGSYEPNGNYLTWIMYSKRVFENEFKDWDMFLFNYEASGSTIAEEKIWLNPADTGAVYVKDRTPPFTECIKNNVKRQTNYGSRAIYRNRERTGHTSGNGHYLANLTNGTGDPNDTTVNSAGFKTNHATVQHGDGARVYLRSAKNIGSSKAKSWINCRSNQNDSGNENDINFGTNLGWMQGSTRKIQVMPGTLTPYEPRFECVANISASIALVAHNQGHRVLFAGNVSGLFITSGGALKPSEGYGYWRDYIPYAGTQKWWSGRSSGSTRDYQSLLNIFTIKDISVKSTTNPTDWYGSGGERELGSAMVGGADISTHAFNTAQHSIDDQTSTTASHHLRKDGDYVNINRLFSLEQSRDYSNTDNEDVRGYWPAPDYYTNTSITTTTDSNGVTTTTTSTSNVHQASNITDVPFGTASGTGSLNSTHNLGLRVTSIKYHGNATGDGDFNGLNTHLDSSARYQNNVIYEIDPIVTMNTIENKTDQSILNIRDMQTIVVPTDTSTADKFSDFKRVLIISGNCIENDNEGANTYIASYQLNKHQMFTTETANEQSISSTITSTSKNADFTGGITSNGFKNTEVLANESKGTGGSSVTLNVDTVDATDALLKNKRIYKSDGTLFGTCTAVNSTTQIVLNTVSNAITNNDALYAEMPIESGLKGSNTDSITGYKRAFGGDDGALDSFNQWDSSASEIGELRCLAGASKVYPSRRMKFTNMHTHFLGSIVERNDDSIGVFGTGVYSPIIYGETPNGIKTLISKVADAGSDLNPFQLKVDSYSNAGGIDTSSSTVNDLDADAIYSQDGLVTFDLDASETGETFSSGSTVYYKLSLTYDGHQESPLCQFTIPSTQLTYGQKEMSLSLNINNASAFGLNKRVTHINVYFTDDLVLKPWTLAKSVSLDVGLNPLWVYDDQTQRWKHRIKHVNSGATYESLNGISSNRFRTMVNWGLAKRMGNYYVYGDCSHPKLNENVTNYLFRSKAGRPDVVDWVNDYLILPTKPVAMEAFRGKLYVWDNKDLYIVNQEGFYVEDVMKGVGIMGKKAVVVTDFGMCFADINNVYLHDGVSARAIGEPILRNTLHKEWRVGYINAMQIALKQKHEVNVLYDAENRAFLVSTKGFCGAGGCDINSNQRKGARAYSFSISKQRWDYVEIPNVKAYAQGMRNKVYLVDGNNIWEHRTLHTEKHDWEWHSKNMSLGSSTQLKVFTKIKLTGSPSGVANTDIKGYIDEKLKTLTPEHKNYTESSSGVTTSLTKTATTFTCSSGDSDLTYNSPIGKGMYLKINDEIVLVTDTSINYDTNILTATISRAQLYTTASAHSSSDISTLGLSYRFPSGSKGYKMRVELHNQTGKLDSIGFIFRGKGVK